MTPYGRSQRNPYRILLVEDDIDQAELVLDFLRVAGPFRLDWAEDLRGLWNHLAAEQHEILLIDYRLPDGTGLEALGEMRRHGYDLPVIMITGQGDERLAVQAMQLGAVEYLVKGSDYLPTLPALIQKAVRAHELQHSVQSSLEQVRYQALLLNNVRDAIVVWNTEGKITYWNPAAEALFEVRAADRLGQPVQSCYFNAFAPAVCQPPPEGTNGHEIERRCRLQDGRTLWISSRVSALRDFGSDGRLIGYMDVARDITSRKRAEEALRTERNFVSTVLDTVGALVVVLDSQGKIVRFNRACEATTGYAFEAVKGRPVWELFVVPEELAAVKESFDRLLAGQFPLEIENHWLTRSGKRRLIAWSNTALADAQGQVLFVIATGIDITERRQAEDQLLNSHADLQAGAAALRQSEARYRAVSELTSDFVYALQVAADRTFNCEWITDAFEAVTGFDPNEIDWQGHWLNLIYPDDNTSAQQLGLRLLAGERDVREFRIVTQDGEVRWVRHYAQPVWDAGEGRVVRIYGAVKDLTERKAMEAQIQAAQTRLAQSARLAAIGELASGVAHHINNPLTTIIAEAQILLGSLRQGHSGRESAEAIEQAGWRVQKTVQQLVDFSRPAASTLEWLSVNDTIGSALDLLQDRIESAGIHLETDLAGELPQVLGNHRQLCDLWVNLLLLAYDATQGQPHTIRISSRKVQPEDLPPVEGSAGAGTAAGETVQVEVYDDGPPIPADELAILFEPNFVKAPGGRGTGIELNICQEIVRQHHGQIRAQSEVQAGTTFHVSFPVEVDSDRSEHLSR